MPASLPGLLGAFGFFWLLGIVGGNVGHELGDLVEVAWALHLWHKWSVLTAPA